MKIVDLRTEYRENPVGLDIRKPRFSWKLVSEEQNVRQTVYRIQVTTDGNSIWDTGKLESDTSIHVEYAGPDLAASTRYGVQVEVWDNKENHATVQGSFETGLLNGTNFKAEWITHCFPAEETACPVFLKEFSVSKTVRTARIYATALGVYEIRLNGVKVGDTYFAPGWTNYRKRLQYQTYNTDGMLHEQNRWEIIVGNGWYKGIFGFTCTPNHYGDRVAALAELHITYTDGTSEIISTDTSWKVATGSIRSSEIYMGETIDSCYPKQEPEQVDFFSFDNNRIIAQESEAVRITERLAAKALITTLAGEQVLDFAQILTGFVQIKVKGKLGQKITIRHAEVLDKEGNFYPDTLRQAISVDHFICNGEEQILSRYWYRHHFPGGEANSYTHDEA